MDDIREWVAEYVAGDLSASEREAFERALAEDAALRARVERWRVVRAAMCAPALETPAPDLRAAILRRVAMQSVEPRRRVSPWLAAAAGLGLAVGALAMAVIDARRVAAPADQAVWFEDGTPASSDAAPRLATYSHAVDTHGHGRPSLGVWFRPVDVDLPGVNNGRGHLVLRVIEGSAVWQAGVRPGDLLLSVAGCPMMTSTCMRHALESTAPGQQVQLSYWSAASKELVATRLTVGALRD